jgi:hypothetical protein
LREKQILARLAREFAVDSEDLVRRLADLRKSARPVAAVRASSADEPVRERRVYAISSLLPTEVELLQLLTRHPELAPTALAEIGDEELGAEVAQVVFQTYRRLEETGENLEFSRVLSEFEDAGLQSLLVGLDEQAEPKMEKASEDPATRMRGVIRFYQRRREERQRRETEAALEKQHFNPQEEMNVLELMLASKRQQQGIVAPTDG